MDDYQQTESALIREQARQRAELERAAISQYTALSNKDKMKWCLRQRMACDKQCAQLKWREIRSIIEDAGLQPTGTDAENAVKELDAEHPGWRRSPGHPERAS